MTTDLSFITNEKEQSLKNRFEILIKDTSFFDCLVGYFYTIRDAQGRGNGEINLSPLSPKLYFLWLYYRGKRKGEMLELYLTPLSEIPIKKIPESAQQPFITLVDQILAAKNPPQSPFTKGEDYGDADTSTLEYQIDKMVYELYGLTPEEIAIAEGRR